MKKRYFFYLAILLFTLITVWFNCNPFQDQRNVSPDLNVLDGSDVIKASQADNPLVRNVRTADPFPLVYNGRYYIVCGVDEGSSATWFNMYSYRLLSSADMSTWTDHGTILRGSDVSWLPDNTCWASALYYRSANNTFYLYVSGFTSETNQMIGVLTATSITGPYTDVNGKPLLTASTANAPKYTIDPHIFINDDGVAYLFYGGAGFCRYIKLKSNLTATDGSVIDVPGLTGSGYTYLEAPFVIKANGTYFLMYADLPIPSHIRYATASSITGPWTHRGVIGAVTGTGTNHPGAAYFNGQWWYTYHTEELSNGNQFSRCVCVDPMYISGSTITPITYSSFWMN